MERVKGISGRQGRLRRRSRGLRSLTAVFRVMRLIIHPDSNPLCILLSLRLGFASCDPLHAKSPLAGGSAWSG